MYVRGLKVSLLACIFSHVLLIALEQHTSFQKNVTEANANLMHACVKFRLSCTVKRDKIVGGSSLDHHCQLCIST